MHDYLKHDPNFGIRFSTIISDTKLDAAIIKTVGVSKITRVIDATALINTKRDDSRSSSDLDEKDMQQILESLTKLDGKLNQISMRISAIETKLGCGCGVDNQIYTCNSTCAEPKSKNCDTKMESEINNTCVDKVDQPKKKKERPPERSLIVFDIMPVDTDVDLEDLERKIKDITLDSLIWGECAVEEVGFGIKKMRVACEIEDEKCCTDDIETRITDLEDLVQSVTISAFQKAL